MFTYLCKPYRAFSFVCAASVLTSTLSIVSANAEVPASNLASVESSATTKSKKMTLSNTSIDLDVYRQHVKTLASDEFEGRGPLSKGEEKTVDYLVNQYKKLGLKPAFGDSYTQAVPLAKITPKNISSLKIGGLDFSAGGEFTARTQRIVND